MLAYLGVCLVLSMLQTSLIFPGAASQGAGPRASVLQLPATAKPHVHVSEPQASARPATTPPIA